MKKNKSWIEGKMISLKDDSNNEKVFHFEGDADTATRSQSEAIIRWCKSHDLSPLKTLKYIFQEGEL